MKSKSEREREVSRLLRAELVMRGITYKNLSRMIAAVGEEESETQLKAKILRGKFSLEFFLLVMKAIGGGGISVTSKGTSLTVGDSNVTVGACKDPLSVNRQEH